MGEFKNKIFDEERWHTLPLNQQMGNIGSEISRAINWKERNNDLYEKAIFRALELIDITLSDNRLINRLKEITRLREVVCDAYLGGKEYGSTLESIEKYLNQFALSARK